MKWYSLRRIMRRKKGAESTSPDAETETLILPQSARTADISPLSLDKYTVRDFYKARGGVMGEMKLSEYDYLLTAYLQAVNPSGYGKMVAEYRDMLAARINLDKAYLVVTLPYQANKALYARLGLSGDKKQCRARIGELERKAKAAADAYVKASETNDTTAVDHARNWAEEMAREVANLSRYLGFAVDPVTTTIGVYIGYLKLMVTESQKEKNR